MSRFVSVLRVEEAGTDSWRLLEPLRYESDLLKREVIVPRGTMTDFASVPRWPLAWFLAGGIGDKSAVVHDYGYASNQLTRKIWDEVFVEALEAEGVGWFRRRAMFRAVRWFGGSAWRNHRAGA